jgi:uncharacterized protein (TIRG00374 family)
LKKKVTRLLSIILPLLLGVFLIIYTYRQFTPQQLETMKGYFLNADYTYIYISLFIGLTGYIARAYRWKYTLEHMGYHSPFAINFFAVSISYFMNMSIPRSGEVSRALVLKNYRDIPFDKGFGTIISERVIDLIILILCIAGATLLQFDTLKEYLTENVPFEKILFFGAIAGIVFIGAILMFMYSRLSWIVKLKIKVAGLTEGVMSVFKMRKKWPFFLLSIYIWVTYILMFYTTIFALPETSGISFGVVAVAFVIGSLSITFSNSGFGVFPVAVATVLALYGIEKEAGTALGWMLWVSQIALIIILGSVSFLLLPLLHKRK